MPRLPRFLLTLVAAVACSMATLAAPALAQTSSGNPYANRFGVCTHLRYFDQSLVRPELQRISASGIKWIREDFSWAQVESTRGVYDWSRTDNLMAAASSADVEVLPILGQSPPWASTDPSGKGDPAFPPKSNVDYAHFVD